MNKDDPRHAGSETKRPDGPRQRPRAKAGPWKSSETERLPSHEPPRGPTNRRQVKPPLVRLPSLFKPALFLKKSAGRGARPASLKAIDAQLRVVANTREPRARFDELKSLQKLVDAFVSRYKRHNVRRRMVSELKVWLDGAIELREDLFEPVGDTAPEDDDDAPGDGPPSDDAG